MRRLALCLLLLSGCDRASTEPVTTADRGATTAVAGPAPRAASPAAPAPTAAVNDDDPGELEDIGPPESDAGPPQSPTPDAAAAPADDTLDDLAEALRALPPDPAPERTTNDTHYLVSNERRHDLFELSRRGGRGGVMLGVGSDQNYVMAPWAGTELLIVVDFDDKIVDLHAIHGALMGAAPTVEEFRRLWSDAGTADAHAVLRSDFGRARARHLIALRDEALPAVEKRLRKLARRFEELGVHSYLDTPQQYRFVADLQARGRVVAIRGDFTKAGVMRRIAEQLDEHEVDLQVLYLSNVEQYFAYRKPFKANMRALPFAEDATVLRTLPGRPAGFHYIQQRADDFVAWMKAPRVWSVYAIRGRTHGEPFAAGELYVAGGPDERPPL